MTDSTSHPDLHFFDPNSDFVVIERRLPHWSQPGVVTFITWRTNDSMPDEVLKKWRSEQHSWLFQHGFKADSNDWKTKLHALPRGAQIEFHRLFSDRWQDELDAGHGECVLRSPDLAKIVAKSLSHFDGDRYDLTDFVVMPNHVHLLAAFRDYDGMLKQCESWKHFQAAQINQILGGKGRFWQQDGFDHLIRSNEQFEYFRRYIANNGRKAGLRAGEFLHFSREAKASSGVILSADR